MLVEITQGIAALVMVIGALFSLLAAVGLLRLPDLTVPAVPTAPGGSEVGAGG